MNMLVSKIALSLLLSANTLAAFAEPGQSREEREALQQQQNAAATNQSQAMQGSRHPDANRSADESAKKSSRLSPEERRALRRQINEAGQDIYVRKP